VRARLRLAPGLFLLVGNVFTQNWLDISPTSKIAFDRATGSPDVQRILADSPRHAVDFFEYGIMLDQRDDETTTTRGTWNQLKLRLSPGGTSDLPYRYAQVNAIVRAYTPLASRVVLAGRVVGDVQLGDPPFYELTRYEDTFALGGSIGVRGVPGQRYYGKVKVFGNLEVRTRIFDFVLFHLPLTFGLAGFFDAGRAFTELGTAHPDLDGTALGLKYGVGLGARLTQGSAFIVRGDVAWSPDARPIGGYFAAGEVF
jgi:outer membrane protein assembly factor BamA